MTSPTKRIAGLLYETALTVFGDAKYIPASLQLLCWRLGGSFSMSPIKLQMLLADLTEIERQCLLSEFERARIPVKFERYKRQDRQMVNAQTKSKEARRKRKVGPALEHNVRLSDSLLWKTLAEFYHQGGTDPWNSDDVPFGISSNCVLAAQYADVIKKFAQGQDEMVYAIDIGSGHGILGYRLARELASCLPPGKVCVLITDFHDKVIKDLSQRPCLVNLVRKRYLDFAVLDLNKASRKLVLLSNLDETIDLEDHPCVFIANYVLDSLPVDIYQRKDGQVEEALVTCYPASKGSKLPSTDSIELNFSPATRHIGVDFNDIILYPRVAISALQVLLFSSLSKERLLIVADKLVDSRTSWDDGSGNVIPGLQSHGNAGCASTAVDTFVIAEKLSNADLTWHVVRPFEAFGFCVSYFGPRTALDLASTFQYGFGVNDFDRLRGWLEESKETRRELVKRMSSEDVVEFLTVCVRCDFDFFKLLRWDLKVCAGNEVTEIGLRCFDTRLSLNACSEFEAVVSMCQWLYVRRAFSHVLVLLSACDNGGLPLRNQKLRRVKRKLLEKCNNVSMKQSVDSCDGLLSPPLRP